jgi:hypothetical protein
MFDLGFHVDFCLTCTSGACLVKCRYMDVGKAKAKEEMIKVRDVADIVLEAMA